MNPVVHYDQISNHCYTVKKRVHLSTINLRNFNNARKRELLTRYAWPQSRILDLCGGKGGDLHKYESLNVKSVRHIDISSASVDEANRRFNHSNLRFEFETEVGNILEMQEYAPPQSIDVVSCQFAIHYAFEFPYVTGWHVIERVAKCLRPRGMFLVTTPNHQKISRFRNNRLCRIKPLRNKENAYTFWLDGAVDAIEFYVPFHSMVDLCKKCGLVLVNYRDYSEVEDKSLRWEERAVASLYCEYAFQKQVDESQPPPPQKPLSEVFDVNKIWLHYSFLLLKNISSPMSAPIPTTQYKIGSL